MPESTLFGGGLAKDIYEEMLDESMADVMARRGGLGLADAIIRSMEPQGTVLTPEQMRTLSPDAFPVRGLAPEEEPLPLDEDVAGKSPVVGLPPEIPTTPRWFGVER